MAQFGETIGQVQEGVIESGCPKSARCTVQRGPAAVRLE
jgi:hypothetical protein